MANTKISWSEKSWNPTTGCSQISTGCKNCFAVIMTKRKEGIGNAHPDWKNSDKYINGFKITPYPPSLNEPYHWRKPSLIFVNSMSDLFHKDITLSYIKQVFEVMNNCPQHIFQVLTKRADILLQYQKELKWSNNIWMGVSTENKSTMWRIDNLKKCDHIKHKFISFEPLLESLPDLDLIGIGWCIVGGESAASNPRIMEVEWATDILKKCESGNIPFFFKQWSGTNKQKNGNQLNGKVYEQYPTEIENFKLQKS